MANIKIERGVEQHVRRQISDVLTDHDDRIVVLEGGGGGGGQVGIQFRDEGANLGTPATVTTVDFVGAGVTASRASNTVTVTIPGGGGGGGGNSVIAECIFGPSFTDKAQTMVTGLTWFAAGVTAIVAHVMTPAGTDPDEMRLLDFRTVISDEVDGVGFTVSLYSEPEAKGSYFVHCVGV